MLGPRTLVMGVINVTPDSFSDGGAALDPQHAAEIAVAMEAAGADILDVGAESTRPGATPVGTADEMARVRPVMQAIARRVGIPISIDTYKSEVAELALGEGASIVNDISGLQYDPRLGALTARTGAPIVLMHTRGRPQDMYAHADYDDVVGEVAADLRAAVSRAQAAGIAADRILIDPGIGFAKRAAQSLAVLASLERLAELGFPLLVGPSRKSFMAPATGSLDPAARDWPTAAAVTAAVLGGAHIVRVHRVAEMVHVVRLADALRDAAAG
ncbi:MAG: dihydropteroate synthase [Vicinamibacterales bacterium]